MLKVLLISSIMFLGLNAKVVEGKEYFKDIVIKDCIKIEKGFQCKKFNKRGILSEMITYDEKGIYKNGDYKKYYDDYILKTSCFKNCEDKMILIEEGTYKKSVKIGEWKFYSYKTGKLIETKNFTKKDLKEKAKTQVRYVEKVQFKGKQIEEQKNNNIENNVETIKE